MSVLRAFEGFGLEVEYMIVDRHTLDVVPLAAQFLHEIAQQPAPEDSPLCWSNELALHAVELKNPTPHAELPALRGAFGREIQRANRVLAAHEAMLMPGAMHPWMDPRTEAKLWSGAHREIYEAFHRVFNCFDHGWANVQSVQLNLPFSNDEEFARLHAAARLVAPIIPAIAAASPVASGQFTGFNDYRMHAYCTHQARVIESIGQVIPDTVRSQREYEERVLAPMYRAIDELDPSGVLRAEWLNVRALAPRFSRHAIEIRNIDSQECPTADLAISQAITAVIRWLFDAAEPSLAEQQGISTSALSRVLQVCIRDGSHALLLEPEYLKLLRLPQTGVQAGAVWRCLLHRAKEAGIQLDEEMDATLRELLTQGTLARRILRAINEDFSRERLATVWRGLCRCLAEDALFSFTTSP